MLFNVLLINAARMLEAVLRGRVLMTALWFARLKLLLENPGPENRDETVMKNRGMPDFRDEP